MKEPKGWGRCEECQAEICDADRVTVSVPGVIVPRFGYELCSECAVEVTAAHAKRMQEQAEERRVRGL